MKTSSHHLKNNKFVGLSSSISTTSPVFSLCRRAEREKKDLVASGILRSIFSIAPVLTSLEFAWSSRPCRSLSLARPQLSPATTWAVSHVYPLPVPVLPIPLREKLGRATVVLGFWLSDDHYTWPKTMYPTLRSPRFVYLEKGLRYAIGVPRLFMLGPNHLLNLSNHH